MVLEDEYLPEEIELIKAIRRSGAETDQLQQFAIRNFIYTGQSTLLVRLISSRHITRRKGPCGGFNPIRPVNK